MKYHDEHKCCRTSRKFAKRAGKKYLASWLDNFELPSATQDAVTGSVDSTEKLVMVAGDEQSR